LAGVERAQVFEELEACFEGVEGHCGREGGEPGGPEMIEGGGVRENTLERNGSNL
jgi:hypothetical protein